MNARDDDSYQSYLLLEEIAKDQSISQRDLSRRLGIAVGLVNSYLKNMVAKGYVRIKSFPRNRYSYLLTPKGIAGKSRLTYHHLSYFTNLYTTARSDFRKLFSQLEEEGVEKILFCGVDEMTDIAYLSLQETNIVLAGVVDFDENIIGEKFFNLIVASFDDLKEYEFDRIIVTSLKRKEAAIHHLGSSGLQEKEILHLN